MNQAKTIWDGLDVNHRVLVLHRVGCREVYGCCVLSFDLLPQHVQADLAGIVGDWSEA